MIWAIFKLLKNYFVSFHLFNILKIITTFNQSKPWFVWSMDFNIYHMHLFIRALYTIIINQSFVRIQIQSSNIHEDLHWIILHVEFIIHLIIIYYTIGGSMKTYATLILRYDRQVFFCIQVPTHPRRNCRPPGRRSFWSRFEDLFRSSLH